MPRLPLALQKELGIDLPQGGAGGRSRQHSSHHSQKPTHNQRSYSVATGHKRKRQTRAEDDADGLTNAKRQRLETSVGSAIRPSTADADAHGRRPTRSSKSSRLKASCSNSKSPSQSHLPDHDATLPSPAAPASKTPLERLAQKLNQKSPASHPLTYDASKLSQVERQEEDEIAWLEAKLGFRNKKTKTTRTEDDDGLEDLLDDLDRIVATTRGAHDHHNRHKNNQGEIASGSGAEHEDHDEDDEDSISSSLEEGSESAGPELGFSDMDSDVPSSDNEAPSTDPSPVSSARYVPPAQRTTQAAEPSEAQLRLSRQIKGLLNKLSEQNIGSILDDLEGLYRNNTRNDVTATLTSLILTSISSHSSHLDTFVVLHAALVCSLHKILGVDFAAFFVQALVESYERHYRLAIDTGAAEDAAEGAGELVKGKEASNLLVLLAELYTFQVVSCVLVYDIVREFLSGELGEFEVELFLKLLKSIGVRLRQDDPAALKDIVALVQAKVAAQDRATQSSRTRFMLETLVGLKNGDSKRKVDQANGVLLGEAVERMKKFVGGIGRNRTLRGNEPLNVSLQDLRAADTKGKWWLVGSAWAGNPLVDRKASSSHNEEEFAPERGEEAALLKLAKKQGMNTDVRRGIFVVLMSSEDYVDACERLGRLKISDQQRPEIVRVLLHCLGNEKAYNPYYTLIAQNLSTGTRNVRFSLQYCLWDLFREFGEPIRRNGNDEDDGDGDEQAVSKTKMRNLAKAYAWWVAKGAVALDVFKPLNFLVLKRQTTSFLRIFFAQLFVSAQSASPLLDFATQDEREVASLSHDREVLEVIMMKSIKSPSVVQGLMYFFEHEADGFVALARDDEVRKLIRWGVKVARDTLGAGGEVASLL